MKKIIILLSLFSIIIVVHSGEKKGDTIIIGKGSGMMLSTSKKGDTIILGHMPQSGHLMHEIPWEMPIHDWGEHESWW